MGEAGRDGGEQTRKKNIEHKEILNNP